MKKAFPRLNRRLPNDFEGVEVTWWAPWWEFLVEIPYQDQMLEATPNSPTPVTDLG
jgi:hypothetical protein